MGKYMVFICQEMKRNCMPGECPDWNGDGLKSTLIATMTESIIHCAKGPSLSPLPCSGSKCKSLLAAKDTVSVFLLLVQTVKAAEELKQMTRPAIKESVIHPICIFLQNLLLFSHTKNGYKRLDIFPTETASNKYCHYINSTITFSIRQRWKLSVTIFYTINMLCSCWLVGSILPAAVLPQNKEILWCLTENVIASLHLMSGTQWRLGSFALKTSEPLIIWRISLLPIIFWGFNNWSRWLFFSSSNYVPIIM